MLGDHVLAHAHLHTQHEVCVLGHGLGGDLGLRVVDVVELGHREAGEPHIGDMHECIESGPGLANHGPPEGREVVGARVAGRNEGGRGLEGDEFVGGNADRGAVGEHVGVQIDETGLVGGNIGLQGLDQAEADADVAFGPQVLAGIEHLAALDEEIELVVWPHGGERRTAWEP